jgi:hypothetical protein
MGTLKITNKEEHIKKIENHLEDARNLLIELCNETYFPSIKYENTLFYKDSIDFLLERFNSFLRNEKIK